MAEWLKAHAWKACIRATVSWVRIPLPPPRPVISSQPWQMGFRTVSDFDGLLWMLQIADFAEKN